MKSLNDLFTEIQGNDELKTEFVSAFKEGNLEAFLKAHNCDATAADMMAFLNELKEGAVSDEDLDKVAGGGGCSSFTCGNGCGAYSCSIEHPGNCS